jgi:hypothetical protein
MWKWVRRSILAALGIIAILVIAISVLLVQELHPMTPFGRGIANLTRDEQIAYLILIAEGADFHHQRSELPITASFSRGDGCPALNPALKEALSQSKVFHDISLVAPDCTTGSFTPYLFADVHDEPYMGGLTCGGLCGGGYTYAVTEPFGIIVVYRKGRWIS